MAEQNYVNWDKLKGNVATLRDEARVKLNLAGKDAKDAWAKLEPEVNAFLEKAAAASDKASEELHQVATDLQAKTKGWLERLRDKT